jgi:hypothetical protein
LLWLKRKKTATRIQIKAFPHGCILGDTPRSASKRNDEAARSTDFLARLSRNKKPEHMSANSLTTDDANGTDKKNKLGWN